MTVDRTSHYDERFPKRKSPEGQWLCRICGVALAGRRSSFCSRACRHVFIIRTNWGAMRAHILKRDGPACRICGAKDNPHVDHIIPVSKGGAMWDEANLQVLCAACNLRKGARISEASLFEVSA